MTLDWLTYTPASSFSKYLEGISNHYTYFTWKQIKIIKEFLKNVLYIQNIGDTNPFIEIHLSASFD